MSLAHHRWINRSMYMRHAVLISVSARIHCFSFCSGKIVEKDDSKSDDENGTKKKARAAGPLEIVRAYNVVTQFFVTRARSRARICKHILMYNYISAGDEANQNRY